MAADPWNGGYSAVSRRHQSSLQSLSDLYLGLEEIDGDDDSRAEFSCPFCSEDFDMVGLCCHMEDEHPVEAKTGVCPVCAARVGADMVGHITMQHGNFFKMLRRRRFRKGSTGSHSTLSLLKKELREGHLQSLLGGSYCTVASSNTAPDPLLSSFIYNLPVSEAFRNTKPQALVEGSSVKKNLEKTLVRSGEPFLSDKDQKEKAQKCKFVQDLFLSTILDDEHSW
eukprot:TRINITY_DN2055_c0_g3_i1.p1 TRINITY_DN2055_c0_g3~~TRINITY_DN2055_c0_g3_i1.p1  ORF type:complete len:225 (+),score=19.00 TRINITY_DN2055_c0_g3_i1:226-900(+)